MEVCGGVGQRWWVVLVGVGVELWWWLVAVVVGVVGGWWLWGMVVLREIGGDPHLHYESEEGPTLSVG